MRSPSKRILQGWGTCYCSLARVRWRLPFGGEVGSGSAKGIGLTVGNMRFREEEDSYTGPEGLKHKRGELIMLKRIVHRASRVGVRSLSKVGRAVGTLVVALLMLNLVVAPVAASPRSLMEDRLTLEEAGSLAIWFIAGEIRDSNGSGWTHETRISKLTPLYSETETPNAYAFELHTGGKESGYVIVSALGGIHAILEFAYSGKPLFYEASGGSFDRVYLTGPLEYAVKVNGTIRGVDGRAIAAQALKTQFIPNAQARSANKELLDVIYEKGLLHLDQWMLGYSGQIPEAQNGYGGIYDPYSYVNDRYGSGWSLKNSKTISGVPVYLQADFGDPNNCTLSTLTMIFMYHRNYSGKTNIPSDKYVLYNRIKTIATTHGWTPENGTPPTKIDDIINDVWAYYGYSGYGVNFYEPVYSAYTGQVDMNRPSSINIASGYYGNHSVALVGYRTYQKSWNPDKGFLKVHDNWTTETRYIDYAAFVGTTVASLSVVYP